MFEKKIDQLLNHLTEKEKVSLLAGSDLWHTKKIERLNIPSLKLSDGPNGIRGETRDTHPVTSASFPVGIAMGATWNPELIKRTGKAMGQEAHTKNVHVILGPTVNIHRTPLAGRNFECYSEDPFLTACLASSFIEGVQAEGVAACIKHFVCNDQEHERFTISAKVSERALQEIYLPPFKNAVARAGVWTIMSAYNRINGIYASENKPLLMDLLKKQWGFDGLVISDWYGTYSGKIFEGGCDLEMPGPARWMGENPSKLKDICKYDQDLLNEKVRRLLRTIFRTNAFHTVFKKEESVDRPEHRKLIRKIGCEAIVLLKNERNLLPLNSSKFQKIAVIGQLASRISFQGGGSSQVAPHYVISPLEALENRFKRKITFAQGYNINKQPSTLDEKWLGNPKDGSAPISVQYFKNIELSGNPEYSAPAFKSDLFWFGYKDRDWDLNHFSIRIQGEISPPETGNYTFEFSLIGRGRLFIDDDLKIDCLDKPSSEQKHELSLNLESDHKYSFTIEYVSDMDVRWRMVRLGLKEPVNPNLFQTAVDLAARSDLVIVVAGYTPEWEAEGFDRPTLDLPGEQNDLIQQIASVNKNTIVVLNTGSPVHMPWVDEIGALVQMWYLGQESGNALADILTGVENPSGKLPTTFPQRIEDNPAFNNYPGENGVVNYNEGIFIGYRHYDTKEIAPLFPFGHGLSYTEFAYSDLEILPFKPGSNQKINISFDLMNKGEKAGAEVVQVYLSDLDPKIQKPLKELRAFRKIFLDAGEKSRIHFELDEDILKYYNEEMHEWTKDPGKYEILIGSSSREIRLSGFFEYA